MAKSKEIFTGTVLDDHITFTLLEMCRFCDVNARHVAEMVAEGIIEPEGQAPSAWRFNGIMLRRVQTIVHLERDLDVNLSGAVLIVELLEEMEVLKRKISY